MNKINIEKIRKNVKKYLNEKRYAHVERVAECAKKLSEIHNADIEKTVASAKNSLIK